ncbi:MAG: SgcJ/EcaC family oxidoreductase [Candidatus Cybelea sp.]
MWDRRLGWGSTDARAPDRVAIGQTMDAFVNAWNAHDPRAFALTFTPDADFTNVLGATAHGRADIESFHVPVFATIFKASHLTGAIRSIRFLTAELAAVDVDWQMTGAQSPNGSPAGLRKGLLDWITQRQSDGSWLIAIMHNTNLPSGNATPPK